jgi:DNA-binding SARP family transcriptional activator
MLAHRPTVQQTMSRGSPRLKLLADFALEINGQVATTPRVAQELIAFLAITRRFVSEDEITTTIWPEGRHDARDALANTNVPAVIRRGARWGLNPESAVDLHLAEAQAMRLSAGSALPSDLDGWRTLDADVLSTWRADWTVAPRERFRVLRLRALGEVAGAFLTRGRWTDAAEVAEAAVRAEPLRRDSWRALIDIYARSGDTRRAAEVEQALLDSIERDLHHPQQHNAGDAGVTRR